MKKRSYTPFEADATSDRPSRSEKKRDQGALRDLVVTLAELAPGRFAKVELPDDLRRALVEARRLPAHNARRRQISFAASLLDAEDGAKVRASLSALD